MIITRSRHDDAAIRPKWALGDMPPLVFIIGLHRSGTTFLYESLCKILPVTKLTVQDVVFYKDLIHSHLSDQGRADYEALSAYFRENQVQTRGNDTLPLSPGTAEEYGWILKRVSGSYKLTEKSKSVFSDMVHKLNYMHPENHAILLKNPWDTSIAADLGKFFPDAVFIFIRRDPIEILNSELGNALHFSRGNDPLLSLLMTGITDTKLILSIFRAARTLIGKRMFSKLCIRLLFSDIITNLCAYNDSIKAIPDHRRIEITYQDLVSDPQCTLSSIASFLQLPLCDSIEEITSNQRPGGYFPLVLARESHLRTRLRMAGLD